MVITVYDWDNNPKFIDVPVESIDGIASIDIRILSGDETGSINLKDGTIILFDASDDRLITHYDGDYTLSDPEGIKKWIEFEPDDSRTISYLRRNQFDMDIRGENEND